MRTRRVASAQALDVLANRATSARPALLPAAGYARTSGIQEALIREYRELAVGSYYVRRRE